MTDEELHDQVQTHYRAYREEMAKKYGVDPNLPSAEFHGAVMAIPGSDCFDGHDRITTRVDVALTFWDRLKLLLGWRLSVWAKVEVRHRPADVVASTSQASIWRKGPNQQAVLKASP